MHGHANPSILYPGSKEEEVVRCRSEQSIPLSSIETQIGVAFFRAFGAARNLDLGKSDIDNAVEDFHSTHVSAVQGAFRNTGPSERSNGVHAPPASCGSPHPQQESTGLARKRIAPGELPRVSRQSPCGKDPTPQA